MRHSRRLTSTLLGATLLVAGIAPGAAAQTPSPAASTSAPQTCDVLTADEVSAALGVTVTVASGGAVGCEFDSDFAAGNYLALITSTDSGDLASIKTAFCEFGSLTGASAAPSAAASTGPCALDVQVGDVPGLYMPDMMGSLLYVSPSAGSLFYLQLVGDPAAGVDKQAALTGLTQLALGRLGSIPQPTVEPVPSQQAIEGAPDLEALLPTQIGGADVTIQSMSGNDLVNAGSVPADFQTALGGIGKTLQDVNVAIGYVGTSAEDYATITAFRVQGADMASVQDTLLPLLYQGQTLDGQTTLQVAGKNVTSATVSDTLTYFYPKDDILWVVTAVDPSLSEIFQKLP